MSCQGIEPPWIPLETIGRALVKHLQETALSDPGAWTPLFGGMSDIFFALVPPRFKNTEPVSNKADTPEKKPAKKSKEEAEEEYASPLTNGRGIQHFGVLVVDM